MTAGIFSIAIWISQKVVMVQNLSKNAGCMEVHHYILLGGVEVTKIFFMAPKGLICKLKFDLTIDYILHP